MTTTTIVASSSSTTFAQSASTDNDRNKITNEWTMAIAMATPQAIRHHSTTIKGNSHNSMHYL